MKVSSGPRPRAHTGARTSDVVDSSDNKSDLVGGENVNADEEPASDVEEAIKSIRITAVGKDCKQTTDKVMRLFINAHLLCGRKHC
jgi:hypothetical protein